MRWLQIQVHTCRELPGRRRGAGGEDSGRVDGAPAGPGCSQGAASARARRAPGWRRGRLSAAEAHCVRVLSGARGPSEWPLEAQGRPLCLCGSQGSSPSLLPSSDRRALVKPRSAPQFSSCSILNQRVGVSSLCVRQSASRGGFHSASVVTPCHGRFGSCSASVCTCPLRGAAAVCGAREGAASGPCLQTCRATPHEALPTPCSAAAAPSAPSAPSVPVHPLWRSQKGPCWERGPVVGGVQSHRTRRS